MRGPEGSAWFPSSVSTTGLPVIFLDTSALVKAYIEEPGSRVVRTLLERLGGSLYLSDHVALEVLATLAYKLRDGKLRVAAYRKMRAKFLTDYSTSFIAEDVNPATLQAAMQLADTHRNLGVGTVDLIHVATALQLRSRTAPPRFTVVCADRSMRLLAGAAGFEVFDPQNDDPAGSTRRAPG